MQYTFVKKNTNRLSSCIKVHDCVEQNIASLIVVLSVYQLSTVNIHRVLCLGVLNLRLPSYPRFKRSQRGHRF